MKKLVLLFTILTSILTLQAQDNANTKYIKRPALGVHFTLNDFKTAASLRSQGLNTLLLNKLVQKPRAMSPGLALSYMKGFSNHIDIQATLAGTFLDLPIPGKSSFGSDYFLAEADVSAHLKMLSDKYWVSPYLNIGVGASNYKKGYYAAFAPLGVGFQLNFWDEAFLLVNSQYRVPITGNNNYHFFHSIGFAGNIGKEKVEAPKPIVIAKPVDSDGDGVFDTDDNCPTVFGVAKYKGCPIPDADGDGVNDDEDKCPTEKGEKRFEGCPVPDKDNDGINDEEDRCPNEAGLAKYNGCPAPDADKDGIADDEDKCPNEAGTVSNQGCPEIAKEIIEKMEYAAKKIFFETGSAKLKTTSNTSLNEVAKILKENEGLNLDIEGHTDNSGNAEKNQTLSENRAKAVMAYLVKKGIDEGRMTSAGFGADQPVADNSTPAGRQQNRRVELKLRSF